MEITKREIASSVVIILVTLAVAIGLTFFVLDKSQEHDEQYHQALQLTDSAMIRQAYEFGAGAAFIEVKISSSSFAKLPENIYGNYYYIEEIEEYYHESSHSTYDSDGNYTGEEWSGSWSTSKIRTESVDTIFLNDIKISIKDVSIPTTRLKLTDETCLVERHDTSYVYEGSRWWHSKWDSAEYRYSYRVVMPEGIYSSLVNFTGGEIRGYDSDKINLRECSIEELYHSYLGRQKLWLILVWLGWLVVTVPAVIGFYYLDNRWLNHDD